MISLSLAGSCNVRILFTCSPIFILLVMRICFWSCGVGPSGFVSSTIRLPWASACNHESDPRLASAVAQMY